MKIVRWTSGCRSLKFRKWRGFLFGRVQGDKRRPVSKQNWHKTAAIQKASHPVASALRVLVVVMLPADDTGLGRRPEHWDLEPAFFGPLVDLSVVADAAPALKRVQTPATRRGWGRGQIRRPQDEGDRACDER